MNVIKYWFIPFVLMAMSATFTSCESIDGPEPPRFPTRMIIHLEYIGLEDFKGELSRIAIFITDENGNFIERHANEITESWLIADVEPGRYIVSAEYIESEANIDNIILGRAQVEINEYQTLDIPLTIELNKIQSQNNK
ncbi:MAG: hypothetical protein Q4C34_02650 [Bacteroidales bacterium]|nr:hypothetical protein [Bacteroidales bacterium]